MMPAHDSWVLLIGAAVVLAAAVHAVAHRARVPSLIGYLALGLALRAVEDRWHLLGAVGLQAFGLLADLGIVVLLFRVGLGSDPAGLYRKLRPAMLLWIGDVALAGGLGYVVARQVAGLGLLESSIVAVALSATSIAVSASVWAEAGVLGSSNGQLMLDLAELDDVSGIALMALLFAVAPTLASVGDGLAGVLLPAAAAFAVKLALFAALCVLAMRYLERPLTRAIGRLERAPQRMLTVIGSGFLIAALASALGFSLAIGALFAGLVFSRDPAAIKTEARLDDLYAFFVPFFFIGIGLQVDLGALGDGLGLGLWLGLWLAAAAIVGKLVGVGLPALGATGASGAALIAASMVPRAEITMIVADQGRAAGLLPQTTYAALVFVSATTCLLTPWLIRTLLLRWPRAVRATRPEHRP